MGIGQPAFPGLRRKGEYAAAVCFSAGKQLSRTMMQGGMMAKSGKTKGRVLRRFIVCNGFLKLGISVLIWKKRFLHDRLPSFLFNGKLFFLNTITAENS